MSYGELKNLLRRGASGKVLRNEACSTANNSTFAWIKCWFASMIYNSSIESAENWEPTFVKPSRYKY